MSNLSLGYLERWEFPCMIIEGLQYGFGELYSRTKPRGVRNYFYFSLSRGSNSLNLASVSRFLDVFTWLVFNFLLLPIIWVKVLIKSWFRLICKNKSRLSYIKSFKCLLSSAKLPTSQLNIQMNEMYLRCKKWVLTLSIWKLWQVSETTGINLSLGSYRYISRFWKLQI